MLGGRLLSAALTLVIATAACAGEGADPGDVPLLPETNAAEVVALLEGSTKPVVVNVWGSWCIPCRSEAPLLRQAHIRFGDRVRFLGIDVRDTQDGARSFINEFDLRFEHLFDRRGEVPGRLGGAGVPLTYFYSPGGELVSLHQGVIDERTLALQIDELLRR